MAKIEPFKAFVYNQEKVQDLSRVVCPPYDIISPAQQQYYHNLNPYNFIHILLGKDIAGEDKYRRAKNYFKDWLDNKIFIRDEVPAIYFYSQQYNLKGEKRTRLGFIACLYLEDKKQSIFGHEHTHLEPREDRLRLLKSVKANLSPIFVAFLDKKRIVQSTYQRSIKDKKPFIDITDEEKIIHKLWRIDSQEAIADMQNKMSDENIFIADGHHRYEVACVYRDEMKRKLGTTAGNEDFNYIMAYFTNPDPHGLTILPVHRLLKPTVKPEMVSLMPNFKNYFDLEEVKDKTRFFFLLEKGGRTEHIIGAYHSKRYWLLRLKNIKILEKIIGDKPAEFRSLDVSILNYIVLKNILALDLENKENISFSNNADELISRVDRDASWIAFFLNPVRIQQVMSVALSGHKMPPKSTYFYPKVLSGLVINKHEEH